jgi:ketosteroid isomerase-like protein
MQANTPALPRPLTDYFATETAQPEAIGRFFTDDAVVVDERHEHRGPAAIAAWLVAAKHKYNFTSQPLNVRAEGEQITVRVRGTGTFPGSPLDLDYAFTIKDGLVARLEIAP